MKLGMVIGELHRCENKLASHLAVLADRHRTDHEIHHVARDLITWSHQHIRQLSDTGHRFGLNLAQEPGRDPGLPRAVREKLSHWFGCRPEPGLLLLADLRHLHLVAAEVSLNWELLGQAAQATKDTELLDLTTRCHPETLRQMRWANAMLKVTAPQALTS
ncbi:MAG: hypothetical protein JOZ47_16315 [Kutzneria sp.]|nr:hypothetical protein [Kutzneria sp.]